MRRAVLLMLLVLGSVFGLSGCQKATTPTEAVAIQAAEADQGTHAAYSLPAAKQGPAERISGIGHTLHFVRAGWGVLQLLLLLELGIAARMRNVAVNLTKSRWGQGSIFFAQYLLISLLLSLPFMLYSHHLLVEYGLSVQHWGSWAFDVFKNELIVYGLGTAAMMLLFLCIKKFPRRWWLVIWFPAMLMTVLGVFLAPYVYDPLFSHFDPLGKTNPAIAAEIEKVGIRGGIHIPVDRMFLMRASDKSTQVNAYVTGMGASKRLVIWDTLVAKATPDEIVFTSAHEMGHYVLGHIVRGVLFSIFLTLVSFFLGFHIFQFLLRRYGKRWRIPEQSNWASFVLLMGIFLAISFVLEPVENTFSRQIEHAADVFGEEAVHTIVPNPQAAAQGTMQMLGENSLDTGYPSAFIEFWTYSHPATGRRAAFGKAYDPWAPGAAPKYLSK